MIGCPSSAASSREQQADVVADLPALADEEVAVFQRTRQQDPAFDDGQQKLGQRLGRHALDGRLALGEHAFEDHFVDRAPVVQAIGDEAMGLRVEELSLMRERSIHAARQGRLETLEPLFEKLQIQQGLLQGVVGQSPGPLGDGVQDGKVVAGIARHQRAAEIVLAAEVMEEGPLGEVGSTDDVVQRGAAEALLVDQRLGNLKNSLTGVVDALQHGPCYPTIPTGRYPALAFSTNSGRNALDLNRLTISDFFGKQGKSGKLDQNHTERYLIPTGRYGPTETTDLPNQAA